MKIIRSVEEYAVARCRGRRVLYCGVSDCAGGVAPSALATKRVSLTWRGFDFEPKLPSLSPDMDIKTLDLNEEFTAEARTWWDGDVVVMTEILEHLWSPVLTLRRISAALPGKEFLISVPNGLSAGRILMAMVSRRKYMYQDGTHTQLHNRVTLSVMLREAGIHEYSITPYMQRGMAVAACFPEFAQGFVADGRFPCANEVAR